MESGIHSLGGIMMPQFKIKILILEININCKETHNNSIMTMMTSKKNQQRIKTKVTVELDLIRQIFQEIKMPLLNKV